MSATLILLLLLSVATLASRRGYAAFVAHLVSAPLLVGVGVLIAPARLALLTYSTVEALTPALRVGAAWLALLVGLRALRPRPTRGYALHVAFSAGVALASWGLLGGAVYGLLDLLASWSWAPRLLPPGASGASHVGMALLLGGVLASSGFSIVLESLAGRPLDRAHRRIVFLGRHDEVVGAVALCLALWLHPLPATTAPLYAEPVWTALACAGLGVGLAGAFGLLGGHRMGGPAASWVALLGLITLAAGLSERMKLPEAAVAFFFGATVATLGLTRHLGHERLTYTARPVRFAVFVLIGTQLGFSLGALVLGVAIAFARLALKSALRLALARAFRVDIPLSTLLGSPNLALPLAVSFALSRGEALAQSEVLSTIAIAVGLTDAMTLFVWRKAGAQNAIDVDAPAEAAADPAAEDRDDPEGVS